MPDFCHPDSDLTRTVARRRATDSVAFESQHYIKHLLKVESSTVTQITASTRSGTNAIYRRSVSLRTPTGLQTMNVRNEAWKLQ